MLPRSVCESPDLSCGQVPLFSLVDGGQLELGGRIHGQAPIRHSLGEHLVQDRVVLAHGRRRTRHRGPRYPSPDALRRDVGQRHRPEYGQKVHIQRRAVPGAGGGRQLDLPGEPGFRYLTEDDLADGRLHVCARELLHFDGGRELPGVPRRLEATPLGLRLLRRPVTGRCIAWHPLTFRSFQSLPRSTRTSGVPIVKVRAPGGSAPINHRKCSRACPSSAGYAAPGGPSATPKAVLR